MLDFDCGYCNEKVPKNEEHPQQPHYPNFREIIIQEKIMNEDTPELDGDDDDEDEEEEDEDYDYEDENEDEDTSPF